MIKLKISTVISQGSVTTSMTYLCHMYLGLYRESVSEWVLKIGWVFKVKPKKADPIVFSETVYITLNNAYV